MFWPESSGLRESWGALHWLGLRGWVIWWKICLLNVCQPLGSNILVTLQPYTLTLFNAAIILPVVHHHFRQYRANKVSLQKGEPPLPKISLVHQCVEKAVKKSLAHLLKLWRCCCLWNWCDMFAWTFRFTTFPRLMDGHAELLRQSITLRLLSARLLLLLPHPTLSLSPLLPHTSVRPDRSLFSLSLCFIFYSLTLAYLFLFSTSVSLPPSPFLCAPSFDPASPDMFICVRPHAAGRAAISRCVYLPFFSLSASPVACLALLFWRDSLKGSCVCGRPGNGGEMLAHIPSEEGLFFFFLQSDLVCIPSQVGSIYRSY